MLENDFAPWKAWKLELKVIQSSWIQHFVKFCSQKTGSFLRKLIRNCYLNPYQPLNMPSNKHFLLDQELIPSLLMSLLFFLLLYCSCCGDRLKVGSWWNSVGMLSESICIDRERVGFSNCHHSLWWRSWRHFMQKSAAFWWVHTSWHGADVLYIRFFFFIALTLLVGWQEQHLTCENSASAIPLMTWHKMD